MTRGDQTYIVQGGHAVGARPSDVISTILGSCVAVCLWDAAARVGGMNHILLPDDASGRLGALSFGASDMERLINALLKRGAERRRFQAKMFGGAAIVTGLSDIGCQNADFARGFLKVERIPLVSESVGGRRARQVRFWPASGRAQVRFVGRAEVAEPTRPPAPAANDVELFG